MYKSTLTLMSCQRRKEKEVIKINVIEKKMLSFFTLAFFLSLPQKSSIPGLCSLYGVIALTDGILHFTLFHHDSHTMEMNAIGKMEKLLRGMSNSL